MTTHKHIDRICCAVLALVLFLTLIFVNGESFGVQAVSAGIGYEGRLFDTASVHTIDIVMDDWDGFIETCENEEYEECSLLIDNEAYKNVGIRAKGNTSLSSVSAYGNDRYSFKIEFDCYDKTKSYYGLDKISLNNIIQDNTYMKDYLCYQMMAYAGADAPLCSFVYITINGEDWGLYLAVEGVEESFLERNYGNDYGELYKPDSSDMGGGRGNGKNFEAPGDATTSESEENADVNKTPERNDSAFPGGDTPPDMDMGGKGMGGMSMGGDDVSLIYTDDEYDSYSSIFDNAKTDITDTDKDRLIASLKKLNEGEDIESVVNIDEVLRYFVVHNFVCNFDSYTGSIIHNYYLYEKDGLMSMIPWDYNLAFGGFQDVSDADSLVNFPIDTPVSNGTVESRPMLAWIFSDEEYTRLYHEYFKEFISDYFDSGYFAETINTVSEMIAPYVEKDPTKFCTYEEFEKGVSALREFCLLRAQSVSGQLDGTIPSTSDGQSADASALIDASSLTISDMGSMGNQGGPGGKSFSQEEAVPVAAVQGQDTQDVPAATVQGQDTQDVPAATVQGQNTQERTDVRLSSDTEDEVPGNSALTDSDTDSAESNDSSAPQSSSGNVQDNSSEDLAGEKESTDNDFPGGNFPGGMERPGGNFPGEMERSGGDPGAMFNKGSTETQAADQNTILLLLAVSAAFLAAGLLFAFKFKR